MSISGLGYYPNPLTPDRAEAAVYVEHIKQVIARGGAAGRGHGQHLRRPRLDESVDDNWPRFLEVWPPLVDFAEDHGVKIGIENCPMLFTEDEWPGGKNLAATPAIWRRMFEEIPSQSFGLNYDPSHLVWQQMDYVKPLSEFGSRIFHVHAKDARVDRARLDEVGILATPLEYPHAEAAGAGRRQLGPLPLGAGRHGLRRPGLHRGGGSGLRGVAGDCARLRCGRARGISSSSCRRRACG